MKSKSSFTKRHTLLLALAAVLLIALLALPAMARETAETDMENVLTYDGLSARTKGCGGIRSVYLVDRDAVASLEESGYSVAYGAIMGIGIYRGNTVNTTRSLAVSGDFASGYAAANANAAVTVVYATGAPAYADGIHLDHTGTSFAYTTTYGTADALRYGVELVYAGFVAVTDGEGNQTVVYDYAEGELFGQDSATYGAATSALELAGYFANQYSKSAVKAYYYNQNATLRAVLATCGEEIRVLAAPIVLIEIDGEVSLAKLRPASYVTAAREAYKTPAYADYTTSIVANYSTTASAYNDRPAPVTLSWTNDGGEALTYTLTLATDALFTQNVRVVTSDTTSADIYNLYTNTTYYFKVEAVTADGYSYETAASTFKTADTVRWIYADGVRNVRDLGGWNGLNQGLIYRGSELNLVGTHGLQITEAGRDMMVNTLGVRTDLDFRSADQNGSYGTASPLGEGVAWVNYPIGNFLSAFNSSYESTMRLFLDYDNYPVYMHCWGGADRTGTVAFMLAGLCGASEEDLAIDLEQTSFASFGNRYRYDNGAYLYASTVARLKTYQGETLQDKFETCFKEAYGFTEAEISQIQAINTQSGAVYDFAEDEHGDVLYNSNTDESFSFAFEMRNSTAVTSVVVDGIALDFDFDTASSTVTVYGDKLIENGVLGGTGVITFDDGASLRFYIETDLATSLAESILAGDYAFLFDGSDAVTANGAVTVTTDGSFEIPATLAAALYNAGYESVSVKLPAGVTVTSYTVADTVLSTQTTSADTVVRLPLNGGRVAFATASGTLTLDGFAFNKVGSSWVDEIAGGDYKAFFGTGTNGINEAGNPILDVESSNFTVSADTVKKLTALGYTHLSFTVDITFADGTTGCYLAIRHGGKRYEQLYPALTAIDGCVKATVTVELNDTTALQLITRTCTVTDGKAITTSYTAVSADSFIISGVCFAKSGSEGAADNHPAPDPNEEYVKAVNGGAYDTLFPSGTFTVDESGNPIQVIGSGNFTVKAENLAKAIAAGYGYIRFKVKVEMPEGVTEGFICVRMNGKKYETLYPAFTTVDGLIYAEAILPIGADTSTLQFISRADYTVDGKVNTSSHDQVSAVFTFSEVCFLKTGTVGVTVVEEAEPSNVDRIMDGDYAMLFTTDVVVENGTVTGASLVHFSHDMLAELYEAGYTSISFRVVSELTGTASATDSRVRVVARWSSSGSNYISNSDKQDIDLGGKLGTAEGTLTFHLTEEFLGETNFIRLHAQTGSSILLGDFVFHQ